MTLTMRPRPLVLVAVGAAVVAAAVLATLSEWRTVENAVDGRLTTTEPEQTRTLVRAATALERSGWRWSEAEARRVEADAVRTLEARLRTEGCASPVPAASALRARNGSSSSPLPKTTRVTVWIATDERGRRRAAVSVSHLAQRNRRRVAKLALQSPHKQPPPERRTWSAVDLHFRDSSLVRVEAINAPDLLEIERAHADTLPLALNSSSSAPLAQRNWILILDEATDVRVPHSACDELGLARTQGAPSPDKAAFLVPLPRTPVCGAGSLPGSSLTCAELGWDQTVSGVSRVDAGARACAASQPSPILATSRALSIGLPLAFTRACSGVVSWPQADAFCRAAGARLCTLKELTERKLTVDTGCGYDHARVWSLSRCEWIEAGHATAPGKPVVGFTKECTSKALGGALSQNVVARCCADMDHGACVAPADAFVGKLGCPSSSSHTTDSETDAGKSRRSCAELGFSLAFDLAAKGASAKASAASTSGVCAADTFLVSEEGHASARCRGVVSFHAARAFCERVGARLCSDAEMAAFVARSKTKMCSIAHAPAKGPMNGYWTSTSCANPPAVVSGRRVVRPGPKGPPASWSCVDPVSPTALGHVACCGDVVPGCAYS